MVPLGPTSSLVHFQLCDLERTDGLPGSSEMPFQFSLVHRSQNPDAPPGAPDIRNLSVSGGLKHTQRAQVKRDTGLPQCIPAHKSTPLICTPPWLCLDQFPLELLPKDTLASEQDRETHELTENLEVHYGAVHGKK